MVAATCQEMLQISYKGSEEENYWQVNEVQGLTWIAQ